MQLFCGKYTEVLVIVKTSTFVEQEKYIFKKSLLGTDEIVKK